jgi:hypothetical protein
MRRHLTTSLLCAASVTSAGAFADTGEPRWPTPFTFELPAAVKADRKWQPGVDFILILNFPNPGGYTMDGRHQEPVPKGKVTVTYYFMYTWAPDLERQILEWSKGEPDVMFMRRPSVGWAHSRLFARMYYALKTLGREDLHFALYDWVWQKDHYPVYHGDPWRPEEAAIDKLNLEFATRNGIDQAEFSKVYRSPEITYAMSVAASQSHDVGSGGNGGSGSIVVNGKYATSVFRVCHRELERGPECPAGTHRVLELVNFLVRSERHAG